MVANRRALVFVCLLCSLSLLSAANCLQNSVSVTCHPCSMEQALEELELQVDCSFSYNATQFPLDEMIPHNLEQVPLREAIKTVTGKDLEYIQRGRHLMFLEKEAEKAARPDSKKEYIIEGTVRNATNGEVVSRATVYTVGNKYSALTNESGYYRLELNGPEEFIGLSYSKKSFFDTIIVVQPAPGAVKQDIHLAPRAVVPPTMPMREARLDRPSKQVEELPMVRLLVPEKQTQRAINLDFLEEIPVQFSILPSIGTNRLTSGISNNSVSLNLLGGYNAELNGLEAGAGVNIIRQDAKGMQLGGIGNIVGGKVRGVQAGGIFNNTRGSVMGLQAAGVYNLTLDTVRGVQAGGVFNVLHGTIVGAQVAGMFNIATEDMSGLQAAGLFNYTHNHVFVGQAAGFLNIATSVQGAQAAGFANVAKGEVTGVQVAGFMNTSGNVTGSQIAGFLNTGDTVNVQVSGFINTGKKVEGVQLGFLNFSDSSALAIGFLSFSVKGYNHLDFAADILHPYNLSYRTGGSRFYNILQVGFGSHHGIELFSAGYGIGTELPAKKFQRLTWNLDLLARSVSVLNNENSSFNLDCQFNPQLAIRIGKKRPFIVLGPSLHLYLQDTTPQNTNPADGPVQLVKNNYPPIFEPLKGDFRVSFWPGFKLGLRV